MDAIAIPPRKGAEVRLTLHIKAASVGVLVTTEVPLRHQSAA